MATEIKDLGDKKRRKLRRYPWDEWTHIAEGETAGSWWMLYRGIDFDADAGVFRNRCYGEAGRRGMKVTTEKGVLPRKDWPEDLKEKLGGDEVETLLIQFYREDAEAEAAAENGAGQ
jgi:hypothetical protein